MAVPLQLPALPMPSSIHGSRKSGSVIHLLLVPLIATYIIITSRPSVCIIYIYGFVRMKTNIGRNDTGCRVFF